MNRGEGREQLERIVALALDEDLGKAGDITSRAVFSEDAAGSARVIAREACVVSGLQAAEETCRQTGVEVFLPLVEDGQQVPAGSEVIRLEGTVLALLACERTLLNFVSRLSGVATLTRRYVEAVQGTGAAIAATRKTSPGLRGLEKAAVVHGGGKAHRTGLFDAALIKDNHIAVAGGVARAVEAVTGRLSGVEVEVEVDTVDQLREALETGADIIMLDNMSPELVRECVSLVAGRKLLEASGGVTLENVRRYAESGVDRISVGALTRSAPGIDLSMEVER